MEASVWAMPDAAIPNLLNALDGVQVRCVIAESAKRTETANGIAIFAYAYVKTVTYAPFICIVLPIFIL